MSNDRSEWILTEMILYWMLGNVTLRFNKCVSRIWTIAHTINNE